ncbi:MAG: aminotransferase class IV [Phycisphaerae bacterium]|nr:aminotransferase class IV [Phycisphaerae bacterium]
MELAMVNEQIMPLDEATISIHNRGVYFGDGVYEAIRVCRGRCFAFERHMSRLKYSLEQMDMSAKVDLDIIRQRVAKVLAASELAEATIYFQITRGEAYRHHTYAPDWEPMFLLTIRESKGRQIESGKAITHPDWRWKRCDIKSLNLLANVLARQAATKAGAYEAILFDDNGYVTEATSSTVLMVKGKQLITTPLGTNILPGITRELVLNWGGELGMELIERPFKVEEMFDADELMVSGTSTEVLGLTQLDDKQIADGKVGFYTDELQKRLVDAMVNGL